MLTHMQKLQRLEELREKANIWWGKVLEDFEQKKSNKITLVLAMERLNACDAGLLKLKHQIEEEEICR